MKLFKKKTKNKSPLSKSEKERKIVGIIARLLTLATLVIAIIVSVNNTKNDNSGSLNDIQTLQLLATGVSPNFVLDPITDNHKTQLINTISSAQLDLLNNNEISAQKYAQASISLESNISFSGNQFGMFYSLVCTPDTYNTLIKSIQIAGNNNNWSLTIISTISFEKLYTEKLTQTISGALPERIYLTTTCNYENNKYSYHTPIINNLTEEESKSILNLIKKVNNIPLNRYVSDLVFDFAYQLSLKTSTNYTIENNLFSFIKK